MTLDVTERRFAMTFDHQATRLRRQDLDREIEAIRLEQQIAGATPHDGLMDRARRRTGSALIAAGRAVGGPETRPMKSFEL